MTEKKQQKVHGIVCTTVSFPNKVPEKTASAIAYDVEKVMFQSVAIINGHYRKKFGLAYDVLEIGLPALEEFMNKEQIRDIKFH